MENIRAKWTSFFNQAYVVLGASLNLAQVSFVVAYVAVLLPQLRQPDSVILIDDDSASWIAAIFSITIIMGNVLVAVIMSKYGRKAAGLVAAFSAVVGWIWIAASSTISSLVIARALQGVDVGMVTVLSSIVTGECSSPQNRSLFTSFLMFSRSLSTLFIHSLGAYISWQITALITAGMSFVAVLVLIYCPESPSWLAYRGRYDECKEVFHWLRGKNEEAELQKMIEASRELKSSRLSQSYKHVNTVKKFRKLSMLITRREFYIPVFIMFHVYNTSLWNGLIILMAFTDYYFHHAVGPDIDFGVQITIMDILRLIANGFGIYLMKTIRRRVLFATVVGLNTLLLFIVAIYVYAKLNNLLPFDHPIIGLSLGNLILATNVIGASSFALTLSAELYPLEFRSTAGGLSTCCYSCSIFVAMKIIPFIVNTYGLHVLFLIYGVVTGYCLTAILLVLPETKDKTLLDIEIELRGKPRDQHDDMQSAIPLTSMESSNCNSTNNK